MTRLTRHPTPQELAMHISELAAAFDVRLIVRQDMPPDAAMAGTFKELPDLKFVMMSPVIDESTYAVALHELGHNIAPLGRVPHSEWSKTYVTSRGRQFGTIRDVRLKIMQEEAAWEWAHHHALVWTDLMQYVKDITLNSYHELAKRLLNPR